MPENNFKIFIKLRFYWRIIAHFILDGLKKFNGLFG